MKIKKWDKVLVTAWKDRWKQWSVLFCLNEKETLIIEWVNFRTKYKKKTAQNKWEMYKVEFPIHVSNVQLIWPDWNRTRIWYARNDEWKKIRITKSTGESLNKAFKRSIKTK